MCVCEYCHIDNQMHTILSCQYRNRYFVVNLYIE